MQVLNLDEIEVVSGGYVGQEYVHDMAEAAGAFAGQAFVDGFVTGAEIGEAGGPWGMLAGAVVGAAAGWAINEYW